jgi:hypothetical protein
VENADTFYGHLEILWYFGIFCDLLVITYFPILVSCATKNLATPDSAFSEKVLAVVFLLKKVVYC